MAAMRGAKRHTMSRDSRKPDDDCDLEASLPDDFSEQRITELLLLPFPASCHAEPLEYAVTVTLVHGDG